LGEPFEIYNHPKNAFVASFVGSPAINFFDSVIDKNRLVIIPKKFEYTLDRNVVETIKGHRGEVRIGVRPEDVMIEKGKKNGYQGVTIYNIENMGMEKVVTLRAGEYIFKAITSADFEAEVNAEVFIGFKADKVHFFDKESHENLA
jgi:multiple sugar transport system ATP-binding protein